MQNHRNIRDISFQISFNYRFSLWPWSAQSTDEDIGIQYHGYYCSYFIYLYCLIQAMVIAVNMHSGWVFFQLFFRNATILYDPYYIFSEYVFSFYIN